MGIKISIYEDNPALLESLSYLIRGTEGFELCSASSSAVRILDQCHKNCPDIILMDINMPDMTGIEATRLVKNVFPDINIMIFTVFEDTEKIFDALSAGATGFMLKKTPSSQIIVAIEELYRGGSSINSSIARKVLEYFSKPASYVKKEKKSCQLSSRETEVLKRLMMGDSYKMVADACCITTETVSTYINSLYKKLQVNPKFESNKFKNMKNIFLFQ